MSEKKNYTDYGYVGDEQIKMDAVSFMKLRGVVSAFLDKETNVFFPEKYKYVNSQTGETIKKLTEKNKHLAQKIVDVEATMSGQPSISRTAVGQELLDIQLLMNKIHMDMIDEGVAKHKSVFEKPLGETEEGTEV